jgi:exonuclease III
LILGDIIRIISWNCNNGTIEQNIDFLSDFHADVVVLQEVKKPKEPVWNQFWFGDNPRKGHAIITSQDYSGEVFVNRGESPYAIPIIIHGPAIFNLLMVWTHAKMLYIEGMQQIIEESKNGAAPSTRNGRQPAGTIAAGPLPPGSGIMSPPGA